MEAPAVRRLHQVDAVVSLVSRACVESAWRTTEVSIADARGCLIIPVRIEDVTHPLIEDRQHTSADRAVARAQIESRLRWLDLGAKRLEHHRPCAPAPHRRCPGGHDSSVTDLALSRAGRTLVTGDRSERVALWNLSTYLDLRARVTELACGRASRGFGREEWLRYVGGTIEYRKTCPRRRSPCRRSMRPSPRAITY